MSELLDAIEHLDKRRVEHLLASGTDPNERGFAGITPLHLAIDTEVENAIYLYDKYQVENPPDGTLIELLITNGANIEARDDKGETPLDWAKRRNHQVAIRMLTNEYE